MEAEALTRGEAETEEVGRRIARGLRRGDVVYLIGELGAGKTSLARGIARGLGASEREVASPTFALLHEYGDGSGRIVLRHLDLYRLNDRPEELDVLGLADAVRDAPLAVEWPGSAIRAVLPPTVEVRIERLEEGSRRIRILGAPDRPPEA